MLGPAGLLVSTFINCFRSSMPFCNCSSKSSFVCVATELWQHQSTVRVACIVSISVRCVLSLSIKDLVGGNANIWLFRSWMVFIWVAALCSSSTRDPNVLAAEEILAWLCQVCSSHDATLCTAANTSIRVAIDGLGIMSWRSGRSWTLFVLWWKWDLPGILGKVKSNGIPQISCDTLVSHQTSCGTFWSYRQRVGHYSWSMCSGRQAWWWLF